jgi:hypothetical protein
MRRWQALAITATMIVARVAGAEKPAEPPPEDPPPAAESTTTTSSSSAATAAPAAAEPPADRLTDRMPVAKPPPTKLRRLAAVGAAIFPGVILRGAGSYVLGERRTARRLLLAGTVGLSAGLVGALPVGLTRANPDFVWPAVPLALTGVGIYLGTWLTDIWVAAGGDRVRGGPRGEPPWSLELGTTWLHDAYRERALLGAAAHVELGRLGLGAGGLLDAQGDARDGRVEVRWRIRGAPAATRPLDDGSRLYVRAGGRLRRDDADDVTVTTGELEVVLRGDLRRLHPMIAGTFLELSSGLGLERATYAGGAHDLSSILLGRFAWGAYLGRRGEAMLYYDHRRDDLAGGLYAWRASGFVGSFGASAQLVATGPWAVRGEVQVGSAWVSTLALRYHGGPR